MTVRPLIPAARRNRHRQAGPVAAASTPGHHRKNGMPTTYNNLYGMICDFDNLLAAYYKALRGHRYARDVLRFSANLEEELITLHNELIWERYQTSEYHTFFVFEPKRRLISALPFRDRVVHHAICNIIEPLFEKKFIKDSYGCRTNKGTHAGSDRLVEFLRKAQRNWPQVYCMKLDIAKFFLSIDREIAKRIIRRTIRCRKTLRLLDGIIDSGPGTGLPIGNLTSQLLANVYLDQLDHFCKEVLRLKYYVRYMDDVVVLHHDKRHLRGCMERIRQFVQSELHLHLNPKSALFPASCGIDFLGYRTWANNRRLRKRFLKGVRRKLKQKGSKKLPERIASWLGHAKRINAQQAVINLIERT